MGLLKLNIHAEYFGFRFQTFEQNSLYVAEIHGGDWCQSLWSTFTNCYGCQWEITNGIGDMLMKESFLKRHYFNNSIWTVNDAALYMGCLSIGDKIADFKND